MTVGQWADVLDNLAAGKLLEATVTGGEPLCRPDIIDLLRTLLSRPVRINLNTNGTLLDDEMIAALESLPSRFGHLMVSLDGSTAEVLDSIRGRGTHVLLNRALQRIGQSSLEYGFYCTLSRRNITDIDGILDIALKHDTWIKFNPVVPSGPAIPRSLLLKPQELAEAGQALLHRRRKSGAKVIGTLVNCAMSLERIRHSRTKGSHDVDSPHSLGFGCGGGLGKISVYPNGDVTPCDHLPGVKIGNLLHQDLHDVLRSPANQEFRSFVERGREEVEECAGCRYADVCLGGCPVIPYNRLTRDGRDTMSCLRLIEAGAREAGR
jgi:radical SAM protein with 4Fe4S-binding SPASM domain